MGNRIVFVLPTLEGGGAERVSLSFLEATKDISQDVHLVVFSASGPLATLVPSWVVVHEIGGKRLRHSIFKLIKLIRGLQPKVVYSTHGYVNIPLLIFKTYFGPHVKLLLREANTPSASLAHQKYTSIFKWLYRWFYPKADGLICQSEMMLAELKTDFGVPRAKLHLIYNPTDVHAIRNGLDCYRHPGIGLRFIAAGAFYYKKGFDRLLNWFSQMPISSHLTLLGAGPLKTELIEQAKALNILQRVDFHGFVVSPWRYFAGADVFLLPSRWEGMPNVVLEALACGTPVIATAEAGGVGEIAAATDTGAVTLAFSDQEFVYSMQKVEQKSMGSARESLLPEIFTKQNARSRFLGVLSRILD